MRQGRGGAGKNRAASRHFEKWRSGAREGAGVGRFGGFYTPRQEQIEYVPVNVEQLLAAKRNASVFIAEAKPVVLRRGGTR